MREFSCTQISRYTPLAVEGVGEGMKFDSTLDRLIDLRLSWLRNFP